MRRFTTHAVLLVAAFAWVLPAGAQEPAPAADPIAQSPKRPAPKWDSLASPRETMFTFLEAQSGALKGEPEALARTLETLDLSAAADRDPRPSGRGEG